MRRPASTASSMNDSDRNIIEQNHLYDTAQFANNCSINLTDLFIQCWTSDC